ncbi:MAG: amidophosphoribosyltransferase [Planctomycetota bacterium]|jgi:amidophosphoribosyltransferase
MCGIIGIVGPDPVAPDILNGLMALQHRGQDAAGLATFDTRLHLEKRFGLVRDAFSDEDARHIPGRLGIGHVRYPTVGLGSVNDAQPLALNAPFGIAMVHNGNVTNFTRMRTRLQEEDFRQINTECDVEVILNVFAEGLAKHVTEDFIDACEAAAGDVFDQVTGAYSVVTAVHGKGLVAMRDPFGIKPCIYGRRGETHIIASESCTLDTIGAKTVRDLAPGEVLVIDLDGTVTSRQARPGQHTPCIFEYIYFARPDSLIDDISVYKTRLRLGEHLAGLIQDRGIEPDVVIPVPDSSRPAAQATAESLGVKFREGLLKNRYIGRTFIMPKQSERRRSVRHKLSPLRLEIEGKKVLLVDDSIVRGTTMRALIQMVRDAGAREVYVASSCPPIRHPCVYGIDMSVRGEFVAADRDEREICEFLGADELIYAHMEGMVEAAHVGNPKITHFCKACMDGEYPTGDVSEEMLHDIESARLRAHAELEGE